MHMPCLLQLLPILVVSIHTSNHGGRPHYFYHALPYGTQATYNPFNVIINGGYGILQIRQYSNDEDVRRITSYDYRHWLETTWQTVGHPVRTINTFGWRRFITTEVFPLTLNMNRNQWVPNYFLHGIGGGLHFRATEEWFDYHGFSNPRLWSLGTMVIYHGLSEVVENAGRTDATVDHIADLYIFDPLGILLFMNDGVCRFFSQTLNLAEWSMQPCYNVGNGNLENMGQFYVAKYPISRDNSWYLMTHFGLHGMFGFSRHVREGHSVSLTAGFLVEDLIEAEQDDGGSAQKAVLTWRAGAFYDLNNALLASVMVSTKRASQIRINVYPGVVRIGNWSPGFFLSGSKEWVFGINFGYVPIGPALGS